MRNARKIGNYIQELSLEQNVNDEELAEILNCDIKKIPMVFKGRKMPRSF
jgi:DNA-directed RNA polymerase specialized sigma subunit